jgi:hypothetical protein
MLVRKKRVNQNAETASATRVIKSLHQYEARPRKDRRGVDLIFRRAATNTTESLRAQCNHWLDATSSARRDPAGEKGDAQ